MHRTARSLALTGIILIMLASYLAGQRLEETVCIPDCLAGVTRPADLAYDPTQQVMYVGGDGNHLIVIDPSTDQRIARIGVRSPTVSMCSNPCVNKLYCVNSQYDVVTVVDCLTREVVTTIGVGDAARSIISIEPHNKVYTADFESGVTIIDGATDQVITSTPTGRGPIALEYNPIGDKVYCACRLCDTVVIIDGAGDSVVAEVHVGEGPRPLG